MQYIKHYPSNLLKDYVECYFIWRCLAPDQPLWVDTPPNAFTAFVFNLENSYSVKLEEHNIVPLPRSFISGQSIRNYSLKVDSQIDQIGIVFKPTGMYHLFDIPLYEFTNTRLDIHAVLNGDLKYLEEKLYPAQNDEVRIQLLESILLDKLKSKNPELDGVDYASQKIIQSYGMVNVTDLLADSFMSRRTFERLQVPPIEVFWEAAELLNVEYANIRH